MFLLAILLFALATTPLFGGSLSALGDLRFRHVWLVIAAIGLQVLIISVIPDKLTWSHVPIHLMSYVAAIAFIALNRRISGVVVIGAGGLMNLTAIALNGGVMPAREAALRSAGIVHDAGQFANSTTVADARVAFLGDIFSIPEGVPILNNVFSLGDILIGIGVLMLVYGVCLKERRRRRIPSPAA